MRMGQCKQGEVTLPTEQQDAKLNETDGDCASLRSIVFNLVSIILFFFDTTSDIAVASVHYRNGNYWYFGLTVAFIIAATIVMDVFSAIWYIEDWKRHSARKPVSARRRTVRVVFFALQLTLVLRYMESLIYGLISRKQQKKGHFYHKKMICEYCDAAYLKLFEAFVEAAPQLVLQLYILANQVTLTQSSDKLTVIIQVITIFFSWISLSSALAFYHRSLRLSVTTKAKMSWSGTIAQVFWYFFVIGPRVLCLALLAVFSHLGLTLFCLIHWGAMFIWIITMKTEFCETRFQEIMYNAVLGVVFIFTYLNPVDKPTRYKYALYYSVTLIENTIILVLWHHYCSNSLLGLPAILFHYLSSAAGITIMICYYLFLHPSGGIKIFGSSPSIKNEKQQTQENDTAC